MIKKNYKYYPIIFLCMYNKFIIFYNIYLYTKDEFSLFDDKNKLLQYYTHGTHNLVVT